jgi:hypothetical protein
MLALLLAACAPPHVADATSAPAASASPPSPPPRVDVDAAHAIVFEPRNVTVVIAMPPIAAHPIGKRLGPVIAAMPQWRGAVQGMVGDPLRDLEWVYATAESSQSPRSALLAKVALGDDEIESRVDAFTKTSPSAAAYDLRVAGAKATIATLGGAPRVVVRAQPHVVAIVPEDGSRETAVTLARTRVLAPLSGNEALRAIVKHPHDHLAHVPAAIAEARVLVVAKDDGGADISADGDCADDATAAQTADELRALLHRNNSFMVRMVTKNILGSAVIATEGSRVTLHLAPTMEQLDATLRIVAALLGVAID